jgi:hypothetical protein
LVAEATTQESTTARYVCDLPGMRGLWQRVASCNGTSLTASFFYGVGSERPLDLIVGGLSYDYHRDGKESTTALTDAATAHRWESLSTEGR